MTNTYSFADISATFRHPSVGQIQLTGEGMGSLTIAMSGDVTSHDLAADGSVMISKMKVQNGTVTINVQQVSEANDFFRRYYNYVEAAASSEWAKATILITSPNMGVSYTCTGVAPQKKPDGSFEQAGKQISWPFLAAKIVEA